MKSKRAKTDSAKTARRRGINPYGRKGHPLRNHHELLASAGDEVVAAQTGLTVEVVAAYRKKHRIPAAGGAAEAPKAAAPVAAAAPTPKAEAPKARAPKAAAPEAPKAAAPEAPKARAVSRAPRAAVAVFAAAEDEVTVAVPPPPPAPLAAPRAEPPAPPAEAAPAARWIWVVVAENGEGATRFAVVAEDLSGAAAAARAGLAGRDGGPWTLVRAKRTVAALG